MVGDGRQPALDPSRSGISAVHLLLAGPSIQAWQYGHRIDLTRAVRALLAEGYPVKHENLATLSPNQTRHIKRFGDCVFTVTTPEPFDGELVTLLPRE
jgi:hypothetical protein